MFRKTLIALLVVTLFCAGCGSDPSTATESTESNNPSQTEAPPDGICPPTVIIDGEEYRHWTIVRYQVEIGEDEILGYITSVVGIDKMPTKNDEANCCELNTPYARWNDEEYGEVYVIKVNKNWYILLPADYPID